MGKIFQFRRIKENKVLVESRIKNIKGDFDQG